MKLFVDIKNVVDRKWWESRGMKEGVNVKMVER